MIYPHQKKLYLAKPCPLCGCETITVDRREFWDENSYKGAIIECEECGLRYIGAAGVSYNEAVHLALNHWNRRANA